MSYVRIAGFSEKEYEDHARLHREWYEEQKRLHPGVEPEDGTWDTLVAIVAPLGVMGDVFVLGSGIFLCTVPGGVVPGVLLIAVSLVPVGIYGLSEWYEKRRLRQNIIASMGLCFKCALPIGDRCLYTPGRRLKYHHKCPGTLKQRVKGFLAIIPSNDLDDSYSI